MAKTSKDLKIPYPVEGLIQSLQMNDTIAPEQSVATAINVIFDRIGAVTTRPGNAQYATPLAGPILSLGKFAENATTNRKLLSPYTR